MNSQRVDVTGVTTIDLDWGITLTVEYEAYGYVTKDYQGDPSSLSLMGSYTTIDGVTVAIGQLSIQGHDIATEPTYYEAIKEYIKDEATKLIEDDA